MITYEDALKKAKSIKPDINVCVEYKAGYMFGKNEKEETFGGGNAPVVILKDDGKAVSMAYFAAKFDGEPIKEFDI